MDIFHILFANYGFVKENPRRQNVFIYAMSGVSIIENKVMTVYAFSSAIRAKYNWQGVIVVQYELNYKKTRQ